MNIFNVGFLGATGGGVPPIEAVGATFSQAGGYDYYIWTGNGTVTISGISVEAVIIGGGGGGGGTGLDNHHGAGGGAGNVIHIAAYNTVSTETITIGAAGAGGYNTTGAVGGNTSLGSVIGYGGGGGGGLGGY